MPVFAGYPGCVPFGQLEFGSIPFDASVPVIPSGAAVTDPCTPNEDCLFTHTDGVEYLVFDRHVVRKTFLLSAETGGARLPFGLQAGAHRSAVAAKLQEGKVAYLTRRLGGETDFLIFECDSAGDSSLSLGFDTDDRLYRLLRRAPAP